MWRFKVKFQRFCEVIESFFLGLALASDIELEALGDKPLPISPDGRGEWPLHSLIVSQAQAALVHAIERTMVHVQ